MTDENIYYVYEHWRLDKDVCFYVGKGHGNRAYSVKKNDHHKAIMAKLERTGFAMEVRIVISGLSEEEAFKIEMHQIATWRSYGVKLANKTNGGEGVSGYQITEKRRKQISEQMKGNKYAVGTEYSDEQKKARSERMLGNTNLRGFVHSDETRAKNSEANKGRIFTDEHKANLSKSNIGNKNGLGAIKSQENRDAISKRHKGKIVSEETKAKMRDAQSKRDRSKETRKIYKNKGRPWSEERRAAFERTKKEVL